MPLSLPKLDSVPVKPAPTTVYICRENRLNRYDFEFRRETHKLLRLPACIFATPGYQFGGDQQQLQTQP